MSSSFHAVRVLALDNRLSPAAQPHTAYLSSTVFADRIDPHEPEAAQQLKADGVAIVLYLLERLALCPRELARCELLLEGGHVCLQFFGVCNPAPYFTVQPGSAEHTRLLAAVEVNKNSHMFEAARRVLRQRTQKKAHARAKREDVLVGQLRETLSWSTRADYAANDAQAHSHDAHNAQLLDARRRQVRDQRQCRLALLAKAASPGLTSWTALLEDIAVNVYCATVH